jgi:hypothetical protein
VSDVRAQHERSPADARLPVRRLFLAEAGAPENTGNPSCQVPRRLAQLGRERAGGDDGPDPRKHDRDGGEHMAADFTEAGGRPGVLDLGARGRFHLVRQSALLLVTARDEREVFSREAEGAQLSRGLRRTRSILIQRKHERVRHDGTVSAMARAGK